MQIYPIPFEQLGPGLSGLCYANWSYANSKYFQEINGTLHTLLCYVLFLSITFFLLPIFHIFLNKVSQ